jgi:ribose/xylose/arabinose/galactoside ABC-type transport system permease subunit
MNITARKLVPLATPLIFLCIFVVYALWLGGAFVSSNAHLLDLYQNTPVILIALGLTVCLVAGQFDLSVGSMATLTSFLTIGLTAKSGWPLPFALLACLAVAIVGGLLNAFLVVGLRINAFIATLGSGAVFLGASSVYSHGTSITPGSGEVPGTVSHWFTGAGSVSSFTSDAPSWLVAVIVLALAGSLLAVAWERLGERRARLLVAAACGALGLAGCVIVATGGLHLPWVVVMLIVVTEALWVMLRYTIFGRHLYALGGNAAAAGLAGVRVGRATTGAFVIAAVLAGLAGVVLAGNQGAASPGAATPYLLPAFAAGFLSTVLFSTGRFHVWGTLLGGWLIVTVSQGLVIGGVPFTWNEVINGAVLIGAVAFHSYFDGARGGRTPRPRRFRRRPQAEPARVAGREAGA